MKDQMTTPMLMPHWFYSHCFHYPSFVTMYTLPGINMFFLKHEISPNTIWAHIYSFNTVINTPLSVTAWIQWWWPTVRNNGNNAPNIRKPNSILWSPFFSEVSISAPPCWWPPLEVSSGRTWTVATYRKVPALNNIVIPVAFTEESVSLPSCNSKNIQEH